MSKLITADLPSGMAHNKIKAVVSNVRTARNSLKALEAKQKLFAVFFTINIITSKWNDSAQNRWFHYQRGTQTLRRVNSSAIELTKKPR